MNPLFLKSTAVLSLKLSKPYFITSRGLVLLRYTQKSFMKQYSRSFSGLDVFKTKYPHLLVFPFPIRSDKESSPDYWVKKGNQVTFVGALVNLTLAGSKVHFYSFPLLFLCFLVDRGHRPEITISSCWYDLFPTHDHVSPLDGIHSFSDLLSDFITLSVVKLSRKPPNKFFPYEFSTLNYSFHPFFSRYGFGRIESIGAVSISLCLLSAGIYVGWESLQTLLTVLHGTTNMVLDIHDITSLLVYFSFLFLSFYRSDQAFSCSPFYPKNCCSVGHFTSV